MTRLRGLVGHGRTTRPVHHWSGRADRRGACRAHDRDPRRAAAEGTPPRNELVVVPGLGRAGLRPGSLTVRARPAWARGLCEAPAPSRGRRRPQLLRTARGADLRLVGEGRARRFSIRGEGDAVARHPRRARLSRRGPCPRRGHRPGGLGTRRQGRGGAVSVSAGAPTRGGGPPPLCRTALPIPRRHGGTDPRGGRDPHTGLADRRLSRGLEPWRSHPWVGGSPPHGSPGRATTDHGSPPPRRHRDPMDVGSRAALRVGPGRLESLRSAPGSRPGESRGDCCAHGRGRPRGPRLRGGQQQGRGILARLDRGARSAPRRRGMNVETPRDRNPGAFHTPPITTHDPYKGRMCAAPDQLPECGSSARQTPARARRGSRPRATAFGIGRPETERNSQDRPILQKDALVRSRSTQEGPDDSQSSAYGRVHPRPRCLQFRHPRRRPGRHAARGLRHTRRSADPGHAGDRPRSGRIGPGECACRTPRHDSLIARRTLGRHHRRSIFRPVWNRRS